MFVSGSPTHAELREWSARLGDEQLTDDDAGMIDELRALEELKCAAEARQARLTAAFDASQQGQQAAAGEPAERQGRGVAHQIALARRESPHRGQQHLALARILSREMPHTMAAFTEGRITEWRAQTMVRETACLPLEHRETVDRALAGDPDAFERYGDRELIGELRKLVCRLDPASVAERRRRAEAERCVTIRPAPDTMAYLTVLLPVAQAASVFASLTVASNQARAAGDPRSRGQVMADTLVGRITGTDPARPVQPVALHVVMSSDALLGGAHDSALLPGAGPIPAGLARELVANAIDSGAATTLRRMYATPDTGALVAMDARSRVFPAGLAAFVRLRDQFCRTPWCDAPIRHLDHVTGAADGGPTSGPNGQGLCESCNHAKQAAGWQSRPRPGPRHTVEVSTPTGHTYDSTAPPVIAARPAFTQVSQGRWTLVA
jgi:hypothetical protein